MTNWTATAPANIALIKYMGKDHGNMALNPSLSYSSDKFFSVITLEESCNTGDEIIATNFGRHMHNYEATRFLQHLTRIKQNYSYDGCFKITTDNNFPPSCGLASSASSFAALTKAAAAAICSLKKISEPSSLELAHLSRMGSGSSCRSFFAPWTIWDGEHIAKLDTGYDSVWHYVVVVEESKKKISSSEAHKRVTSSNLFPGRVGRAQERYSDLLKAFSCQDWQKIYDISWADFWDMHALFETSSPAFGYISAATIAVLSVVRNYWEKHHDGPIVTLDAGPNIHLIFHEDHDNVRLDLISELQEHYKIMGV